MRGIGGRADGKLQSFNLVYLAMEHLWNAVSGVGVRVDSRHQKKWPEGGPAWAKSRG
jgi:hypothetical protein